MADAANSGFFINVDGSKGPVIRDLEVRGRDSLYVFVEANVDPANQNSPLLIKDSIVFITNGVRQDVKLEAYGQDVNVLRGEVLPDGENITFSNEKPYLIYDSLVVSPASSLILPEGTTLYFHSKAVLQVKGKVEAQGVRYVLLLSGEIVSTVCLSICRMIIFRDSGEESIFIKIVMTIVSTTYR